jgi:hypothetical protein
MKSAFSNVFLFLSIFSGYHTSAQDLTTCDNGATSQFVVITTKVNWASTECACSRLGLFPADITIANFPDATQTAFKCLGARGGAWVRSWNTDRYGGTCLKLNLGDALPGGAINPPVSCDEFHPTLCSRS